MFVWIAFYFVLFLLWGVYRTNHSKKFFVAGFLLLFLFTAFRFDIGWDYHMYYTLAGGKNYGGLSMVSFHLSRMEPAVLFLLNLSESLKNPQLFFIVTSVIILLGVTVACFKLTRSPEIALMFFLSYPHMYLDSLSTIRQWCAIAIVYLALNPLLKGKKYLFVLLVLLASAFHSTALIFLGVLLVPRKELSLKFIMTLLACGLVFKSVLINFMLPYMGKYAMYILEGVGEGGGKIVYANILVFFVLLILRKRVVDKNESFDYLFNIMLVGTFFSVLLAGFGHIAFRVPMYFFVAVILIIPCYMNLFRPKKFAYIIFSLICICLLSASLLLSHTSEKDPYIPYKNFMIDIAE